MLAFTPLRFLCMSFGVMMGPGIPAIFISIRTSSLRGVGQDTSAEVVAAYTAWKYHYIYISDVEDIWK